MTQSGSSILLSFKCRVLLCNFLVKNVCCDSNLSLIQWGVKCVPVYVYGTIMYFYIHLMKIFGEVMLWNTLRSMGTRTRKKIPSCNRSGNHCFKWISLKAPDYALLYSGWCLFNSLSNISPFILLDKSNGMKRKLKIMIYQVDQLKEGIQLRSQHCETTSGTAAHRKGEGDAGRYRPHNKGGGPVVNPLDPLGPGSVLSEDGVRAAGAGQSGRTTKAPGGWTPPPRGWSSSSLQGVLPARTGKGPVGDAELLDYLCWLSWHQWKRTQQVSSAQKSWNFQAHYDLFAFTTQVQPLCLHSTLPNSPQLLSWQKLADLCAAALILICFMCTCCFCLRHHCLPGVRLCPYLLLALSWVHGSPYFCESKNSAATPSREPPCLHILLRYILLNLQI